MCVGCSGKPATVSPYRAASSNGHSDFGAVQRSSRLRIASNANRSLEFLAVLIYLRANVLERLDTTLVSELEKMKMKEVPVQSADSLKFLLYIGTQIKLHKFNVRNLAGIEKIY